MGVKKALIPFLPQPRIVMDDNGAFGLETCRPGSIGRAANFFGNFGIMVRAYAYIIMLGREGLIRVTEQAVLNANYIKERLKSYYDLPYDQTCMHECVFSASRQLPQGVHAIDIAKFLIDRGYHPPTVYFPLNRQGSDHDRADRDREQGCHGCLYRGDDRGRQRQPRAIPGTAGRTADHAGLAAGRDQGGAGSRMSVLVREEEMQ